MKKILTILIFAAFASCSNDDGGGEISAKADIIGKWYYVADIVNGDRISHILGQNDGNEYCNVLDDYLELTADGNYNTYYFEHCMLQVNDYFGYAVKNDIMTIFYKESGEHYTDAKIKELSENRLVLEMTIGYHHFETTDHVLKIFKR